MPPSKAAFLIAKDTPLKAQPSTYVPPGDNQIVIKDGAIAINPYDFAIQTAPNHLFLKHLGASECYDFHNSPNVVRDIVSEFKSRSCAGAVSIGTGSVGKCIDILGAVKGRKKFISQFAYKTIAGNIKARRNGATAKFVNGGDLFGSEVGKAVFVDFLPEALEEGRFVPAPERQVVGRGLEFVQEAVDVSVKGISARKLVVSL